MDAFNKQPHETFAISVDFGRNMEAGETLATQTVTAATATGEDATAEVVRAGSVTNDGATKVTAVVLGGQPAQSPYQLTVRAQTSIGHQWEHEILMRVVEL